MGDNHVTAVQVHLKLNMSGGESSQDQLNNRQEKHKGTVYRS